MISMVCNNSFWGIHYKFMQINPTFWRILNSIRFSFWLKIKPCVSVINHSLQILFIDKSYRLSFTTPHIPIPTKAPAVSINTSFTCAPLPRTNSWWSSSLICPAPCMRENELFSSDNDWIYLCLYVYQVKSSLLFSPFLLIFLC